jgi:beta-galactosidase
LNVTWSFRLDAQSPVDGWRTVTVPHTWQIEPEDADHMGVGWYRQTIEAPPAWSDRAIRVEFEAVFHSATVWLNGSEIGRHTGKGYTAFVSRPRAASAIRRERNTLLVRADNSFNESMLPRGKSSASR